VRKFILAPCAGLLLCAAVSFAAPLPASPATTEPKSPASQPIDCKIVYAGFVGAMETSNHKHSGVVQIRDTLRGPEYGDVCAESFIPISWESGRDWILTHFASHAGTLTESELLHAPRVILVGHSTGGWAMLSVARDLRDKGIPVELTVQVDSVGFTDYTVPRNVKTCAIFHAWDLLMFMTTKSIRMQDPAHTKLIANIVVKNASHLSITRDPRIREFVLKAVADARAESVSPALAAR
jgi:pimeloyl-ACP methyl ester carboxylesterase